MNEERFSAITAELEEKYGDEYFAGTVKIAGNIYVLALKAPNFKEQKAYQNANTDYVTSKFGGGKSKASMTPADAQQFLLMSCIVDDVPGVATKEDYKNIILQKKPALLATLIEKIEDLASAEIVDLKKLDNNLNNIHASADLLYKFFDNSLTENDKYSISYLLAEYLHNTRLIATVQLTKNQKSEQTAKTAVQNSLPISIIEKGLIGHFKT